MTFQDLLRQHENTKISSWTTSDVVFRLSVTNLFVSAQLQFTNSLGTALYLQHRRAHNDLVPNALRRQSKLAWTQNPSYTAFWSQNLNTTRQDKNPFFFLLANPVVSLCFDSAFVIVNVLSPALLNSMILYLIKNCGKAQKTW